MWLGDSMLWGRRRGPWSFIAVSLCAWKAQEVYFGKHLTRIHCHIVTLSFFPSIRSLFVFTLLLSLLLMHTHARRHSNLTLSLKTAIIASQGYYYWVHIEYARLVWYCHKMKDLQRERSIEVVLMDNIINQSERSSWMLPFLITLTAIISYWPNCHSLAAFIAVSKGASPDSQ